jgi:regulator of replication initiation timing
MYYDEFDYEQYYEPSEVDQIVDEFSEKIREFIVPNIKKELEKLRIENEKLKTENEKLKKHELEVVRKEKENDRRAENLKREVENEFYKTNVDDVFKDILENSELWFADRKKIPQEKCDICNEDGELVAIFPNGEATSKKCKCNDLLPSYVPEICTVEHTKFNKRDGGYHSDRKFYFTKSYFPSSNSNYDYDYMEFNLLHTITNFNEEVKEIHKEKGYGTVIGFISKEECQKYCDWLNIENGYGGKTTPIVERSVSPKKKKKK